MFDHSITEKPVSAYIERCTLTSAVCSVRCLQTLNKTIQRLLPSLPYNLNSDQVYPNTNC